VEPQFRIDASSLLKWMKLIKGYYLLLISYMNTRKQQENNAAMSNKTTAIQQLQ